MDWTNVTKAKGLTNLANLTATTLKVASIALLMGLTSNFAHADAMADKIAELTRVQVQYNQSMPIYVSQSFDNIADNHLPIVAQAERQSSGKALSVLQQARKMTLNERQIISGGCWDYLNAVFRQAGATLKNIHEGVYQQGPYANVEQIQAGDWLYYINHGYHDIEHSGMFIGWVDKSQKQALILSYAGEHRQEPARYRVYDLSHVYQIMRAS